MSDETTIIDIVPPSELSIVEAVKRTSSAFCSACLPIWTTAYDGEITAEDSPRGRHHETVAACHKASIDRCSICRIVWYRTTEGGDVDPLVLNLEPKDFSSFAVEQNGHPYSPNPWPEKHLVLRILLRNVLKAREMGFTHTLACGDVTFGLEELPAAPSSYGADNTLPEDENCLPLNLASRNTAECSSWDCLQGWIDQCKDYCGCLNIDPWYTPTRLLDVESVRNLQLTLKETENFSSRVPHIALSQYCGGSVSCMFYDSTMEWSKPGGVS